MGAFEHVLSLLSFVYALAIAHLLSTLARLVNARERVRFSWFHAYWMLNAMIVLVVDWISYWDMHSIANWSIVSILFVIAQSFVDFMQAALVCPEVPAEGPVDLAAFHASHARRYIGAFCATGAVAVANNMYFGGGYNIADYLSQNLVVAPMTLIALIAVIFRRRWVDITAPILLLGIWGYYLSQLQSTLK